MNLADATIVKEEEKPAMTVRLTASQRRDLEIDFAQALDASSDRHRNYPKADALFQKCLGGDPANPLIITAYLENLARWQTRKPKATWRGWWSLRQFNRTSFASAREKYAAAISVASQDAGIEILENLARICREMEEQLAEETFLREILSRDAKSIRSHARLAEIRLSQADFENARCHFEIAYSHLPLPEVEECLSAIKEPPVGQAPADDANISISLESARAFLNSKNFTAAENLLARAQAISGQNLAIREAREDLQLAQLRFQFTQLTALEEKGNTLAAKARQSLYQKLTRLTLDIAGTRADRYPGDWQKRFALVRELIGVGNYYEVLRRLREPPTPPMGIESATAQKLLAETQQRLRQFDKALGTYRELLQSESLSALSSEDQIKIRAQADRLAAAMQAKE